MTKHRDELLSNDRELALLGKVDLRLNEIGIAIQILGNQLGEELEHAYRLGIVDLVRCWVDGTERSEKAAVATRDRDGDIASQAIDRRCVMVAVLEVVIDIVDDNKIVVLPDLVANRRPDFEFSARP